MLRNAAPVPELVYARPPLPKAADSVTAICTAYPYRTAPDLNFIFGRERCMPQDCRSEIRPPV